MEQLDSLAPEGFPQLPAALFLSEEERATLLRAGELATRLAIESDDAGLPDTTQFFDEMWMVCAELRNRIPLEAK